MRAVVARVAGGPEVLGVEEVPEPDVAPGHVLVRVAAAGVNFADVVMRLGATRTPFPLVPGLEGAGTVEAVGEGASVAVGDRVAWAPVKGAAGIGAYAERAAVAGAQVVRLPDDVPCTTAAAVLLQGLTAHYLATEIHPVGPGTTVLVHAAAGGTGRLVVQWCRHLGATVVGTVSTAAKAHVATDAGVDHVIRYDEQDVVTEVRRLTDGRGVDYVVDGVVKGTFPADLRAVADRGTICVFGRAAGVPEPFSPLELMTRSITVTGGSMVNHLRTRQEVEAKVDDVWRGIRDGWLVPLVHAALPLEEAADAHRRLEGRATTGKLVLTP